MNYKMLLLSFLFCFAAHSISNSNADFSGEHPFENSSSEELSLEQSQKKSDLLDSSEKLVNKKYADQKKRGMTPATSLTIPTGFGANFMDFYFGGLMSDRGKDGKFGAPDAVLYAGLGLGNPFKYVGFDLTVVPTDVKGDILGDGYLSAKLHRRLPWRGSAVAVGASSFTKWGRNTAVPSYYLVFSKKTLFSDIFLKSFTFHLGAGSGFYVSAKHARSIIRNSRQKNKSLHDFSQFREFAGVSFGVFRWLNLNANYRRANLDAGVSIAPFYNYPLNINLYVIDLIEPTTRLNHWYFISVGYSVNFLRLFH